MDINKILVPTDFSDNAEAAFGLARSIAKMFDAKIILVHARQLPLVPIAYAYGAVDLPPGIEADIKSAISNNLEEAKQKLGEDLIDDTLTLTGTPFLEICNAAKEQGADMIIMATHGHTGIAHLVMGSTAERVVRKAACPVLTVRPQAS